MRSRNPLRAIWAAVLLVGPLAGLPAPLRAAEPVVQFQDSGQVFGTLKGHFGRANAWADLDGNGLLDVITGGHDDGLLAYYQESPLQFRRVDAEVGLADYDTALYGILILDFDRDGDPDIVLNQVGFHDLPPGPTLRYLRNNGRGRFTDATLAVGFAENGHGFGIAGLDFDRDGWVDLYVLNHRSPNALYRNLGGGIFENVTEAAGVGGINGRFGDATGVTTLDYDRDGWTDLLVTQRDMLTDVHPHGNNLLLRNEGNGTFTNRALEAGVAGHSSDFVASSSDFDNDGWPDLYLATFNFGMNGYPETDFPNRTYLNQGDGTFVDVSLEGGAAYVGGTMGLAVDDADNDGWVDIYVGNGGPFVLQVEDQIFYRGLGQGKFRDQTVASGLQSDARGHGNTWLDIDRDGDLDLFASLGGHTEESRHKDILYLNLGPTGNFLEVEAVGTDCTREGLGVQVAAHAPGLSLYREIRATGGFDSMRPPSAWFGLADAAVLDSLVVQWPCGRRQVRFDVPVNEHLRILEVQGEVSNFAMELRLHREADQRVRIEVSGQTDALDPRSLELSRRVAPSSSWSTLPVKWSVEGEVLVAHDPDAPWATEVQYRVRGHLLHDEQEWITRERTLASVTSSRFWLRTSPNPFAQVVEISAPAASAPSGLRIFDVRGREIRRLDADQATATGAGVVWIWDGRDASGDTVASGVYVAEVRHEGRSIKRTFHRLVR